MTLSALLAHSDDAGYSLTPSPNLRQELDARSLIDLLGHCPGIIAQHAARSGTPMSDYIALKDQLP